MALTIKWLGAVGLGLALLLGCRDAAAQASKAVDPAAWGLYTQLAGSTRQAANGGYRLHWRWSQPGEVLVEEYIAPASGKLSHTNTITLGPSPGTLHVRGSSLGGKQWHGTLQPDGSVVYAGTGLLKMSYKAMIGSDGAYEIRMVKLRDGAVVSIDEPTKYNSFLPIEDAPADTVAPAPAVSTATPPAIEPAVIASAADAPGPARTPSAGARMPAVAASSAPVPAPVLDPAQLARQHALNQRFWTALTGPAGAGVGRWSRAIDGALYVVSGSDVRYADTTWMAGANGDPVELKGSYALDAARGTWTQYNDGEPTRIARVASATGNEFQIEVLPELGMTQAEAAKLAYKARFGPGSITLTYVASPESTWEWRPETEALALFEQRIVARKRELAASAESVEAYKRSLVIAQQQIAANIAQQEMLDAQADAEFEMERQEKAAAWAQHSAAVEHGLGDSISRLDNTVASVEAQQAWYRAQQEAMRAQQDAAARAADAQHAREATERQYETAREYEAARQREAERTATGAPALVVAATPASVPPAAGAAAPAGGTSFVFCVAIKPGAYMDAPGAMFLSDIGGVDKQTYSAMAFQDAFGSRVNAQYGVSVGSSSCTSHPDRATARARWQEQHDTFGLKSYAKVLTGIAATL